MAYEEELESAVLAEVSEGLNRLQDSQVFRRFPASLPAAACLGRQNFVILPRYFATSQPSIGAVATTLDEVLQYFAGRARRDAHGLHHKTELNSRRRRYLQVLPLAHNFFCEIDEQEAEHDGSACKTKYHKEGTGNAGI